MHKKFVLMFLARASLFAKPFGYSSLAPEQLHQRLLNIVAIVLFSLISSALFFCAPPHTGTENKTPIAPEKQLVTDTVAPAPSVINIPVRMQTRVIEQMLNDQLSGLLYSCDTLSLGAVKPVKIKVWKGDSIRIGLEGNELHYKVPLRLWLRFSFTIGALGLSHTEYQDVEASLALEFHSRFLVDTTWKLSTITHSDGYAWLSDPVIKARFLTIPIKPVADLLLTGQQKAISSIIDKQVGMAFNMKALLLPLWSKIQDPVLISRDPPVWLRLTPLEVYLTPFIGIDSMIISSVGVNSVVETFFADSPSCHKRDSLPAFKIPTSLDSSFVLNLYSEISYEAATQMLRGLLVGREFTSKGKEVIVKDVSMAGVKGYALICMDFIGSYEGRVYVFGRPQYDPSTTTVSIEDLDFDLSTRNIVHKTANWLLHGVIIKNIKPYLKFPLKDKVLESKILAQKMLGHSELSKNIFLSGSVDSLSVGGVRLTDKAIQATVFARGSLQLSVHD